MMNYHLICMQILRKEEKNMKQESVLNVGITKSFLLFWNHYDVFLLMIELFMMFMMTSWLSWSLN